MYLKNLYKQSCPIKLNESNKLRIEVVVIVVIIIIVLR